MYSFRCVSLIADQFCLITSWVRIAMANLDFQEIAQLLNHSRTTQIELSPIRSKDGSWAVYKGEHRVHTSAYPFRVLYLQSSASQEEIRAAAREVSEDKEVHVVYPPSLGHRHSVDLGKLFKSAKGVWTTKDYLASFIKDELQTYLNKIAEQAPEFYTDPHVNTPAEIPRKIPNPVLSFLRESDSASSVTGGRLGILLADPGQGKTYMSRYLVSEISKSRQNLVPLMVDSTQWHTMSVEDQRSLAKTIAHSFRHFDAPIGWLEGHEEQFLRATLKADLFRIVFDGFDEYILRNKGTVQPMEVLKSLVDLATTTGTRIVITSRTSFWNTNLLEAEVEDFLKETGSLVYTILPFDLEKARNYFRLRLGDERRVNQAVQLYRLLREGNEQFVGRGFVLSLIADLVERGAGVGGSAEGRGNALLWLIEALCEREVLRQNLPFNAKQQIEVFRTFITDVVLGESPSSLLLEVSMSEVRPNLDEDSIRSSIEKLKSHPLLELDKTEDVWRFKQEQIGIVLLAYQIVKWSQDDVSNFMGRAKLKPDALQDLGTTIVGILVNQSTQQEAVARLRDVIAAMTISAAPAEEIGGKAGDGSRLAALVALNAVEYYHPKGKPHLERTERLLEILGGKSIRLLSFTGTIARFDFRGVTFDQCRFERVTWANCKFDETTIFKSCLFAGGIPPVYCEGFGSVQLVSPRLDPEAEAVFNNARVLEGKRSYSVDDLRNDVNCVINKFITKGGVNLRNVEEHLLTKGPISVSPHRDKIIGVLKDMVFKKQGGYGDAEEWYRIRKSAVESVKFYAANNVFTGRLQEAFDRLRVELLAK